jgi:hypothetical protein
VSEHDEQAALFQYVRAKEQTYPLLALLFAVPNGGYRNPRTAGRLWAEGVRSGVPDICLPVPAEHDGKERHGLWIEMKVGKNTTTDNQKWWLDKLWVWGHEIEVCHSWIEAWNVIVRYLKLPDSELVQ